MSELPLEVERLLLEVVADGFTVYCCGPRSAPHALAASYDWSEYVDHITIWSWDRVVAARFPKLGRVDVFAPEVVVWAYEGSAEPTVRALLDLVHPQHPDAPATVYPAPRSLRIPRFRQRPMSIQLPSVSQAGVREDRLRTSQRATSVVGTEVTGARRPYRGAHGSGDAAGAHPAWREPRHCRSDDGRAPGLPGSDGAG